MRIAGLTFDGFNEIDAFVAFHILNRVKQESWSGWSAEPCPSESVTPFVDSRVPQP